MNLTYIRIELLRQVRDVTNIMFVVALPVMLYLIFGAQNEAATIHVGHGTISFHILVSMAAYGTAMAVASIAASAAAERAQGWGRYLALTKAPRVGFAINKGVVALLIALVAMMIVYSAGWATGAQTDSLKIWWASFTATCVLLPMWALYGFAAGSVLRPESAGSLATGLLTFFGFFGNLFIPLSGTMLELARFTPMYGYAVLVNWPVAEGQKSSAHSESLQVAFANLTAWCVIFLAIAVLGIRRSTRRQ